MLINVRVLYSKITKQYTGIIIAQFHPTLAALNWIGTTTNQSLPLTQY